LSAIGFNSSRIKRRSLVSIIFSHLTVTGNLPEKPRSS
jgi:hypothetical protein